jgi:uncharacterized protein DUF3562
VDAMPIKRGVIDESAITALVQQTEASYEVVKQLYHQEFAALRAEAKVEAFLTIIASRRVRQRLRAARPPPGMQPAPGRVAPSDLVAVPRDRGAGPWLHPVQLRHHALELSGG